MSGSIAVVGMACRYPGASTASAFWRNLEQGVESVSFFSDAELLAAGVEPSLVRHPQYVKAGAVLDDIELFDAGFFRFSPREAEILDVQHRLFLECAWQALEDACCIPERFSGSIGVYAGAGVNGYLVGNLLPNRELLNEVGEFQAMLANDKDYLSTRVSYKLNLRGPSISVQTACSTSLVAIHLASQALAHGECDLALAGGISLRVPHRTGYLYREGMILSPDGHCRAFDAKAAGTVAGSGVGIVVLKRLEDALADRDLIHAIVAGSAINNDGSLKVGYTAPSVEGQRAVISEALAVADVSAAAIGLVEAHGTGTPLGDPVEFAALCQAFRPSGARVGGCALGSVKTNFGHLDAAAGVAGFMKAVLALREGRIPPTLHFTSPNREVPLAGSPFRINTRSEDWPGSGDRRRAGVSSFGIGGTNAHVILEQPPAIAVAAAPRQSHLIVVSARSAAALAEVQADVSQAIESDPAADLDDVAAALMLGRRSFDHRAAIVAGKRDEVGELRRAVGRTNGGTPPRVVFMFPGQGSQYPAMGAELYRLEPGFRAIVDHCCDRLAPLLGRDLRTALFEGTAAAMTQTRIAQPAIFVVEYALARQLIAWGVKPDALIGHSIGEFTAACIGGAMDLDEALALIAERGRLMQRLPPGRMIAVRLPADELLPELEPELSIAAINSPDWCVASGTVQGTADFSRRMLARGVECQPLQTSHAFHSAMVDPILDEFSATVARMSLRRPSVRWISNVTGSWITDAEATDPAYWTRHLRETVHFSRGLQALLDPSSLFVEVGPGRALATLALAHAPIAAHDVVPTMRHPRDQSSEERHLLRAVGRIWTAGVAVDWSSMSAATGRRRVSLPTTPFDRQRYWVAAPGHQGRPAAAGRHRSTSDSPEGTGFGRNVDDETGTSVGSGFSRTVHDDLQFSVPTWVPAPIAAPASAPDERWLFFAHDGDAAALALMARNGAQRPAAVVSPGGAYRRDSSHRYTIRPGVREDYDALLSDLKAQGDSPSHIVHAWSAAPHGGMTPREAAMDESLFSLLWLAQAIGADDDAAAVRVDVLSSRMQSIGGEPSIDPMRAALLGPVRVIPREYPAFECRSIDYDAARVTGRLVDLLFDEIVSTGGDQTVAYRNHQRYVQRLEPQPVAAAASSRLRRNGHYFVTGGLGGVGLVIAGHLAAQCAARITLVGRSPVPPGDSEKGEALARIERAGAQVCALTADVADAGSLAAAIGEAQRRFGPIDAVIHAAGVPAGGMIARKTRRDVETVISPKIDGALNLSRLFEALPLDFMIFMSSVTAFTGEVGQVDYCAANACLDALAQQLRAGGRNACSVNWDAWREVGMAAATRLPGLLQTLRDERLAHGIANAEGADAFERVVGSGLAQVAVSRRDLRNATAFTAETVESAEHSLADSTGAAFSGSVDRSRHPRPALTVPFAAPASPEERTLCEMWEALLGIDGIGLDDDFFELGGHSLLATQLLSRIRDRMAVRLSLASFFDHSSVRRLARLIETKQVEVVLAGIEELSEDEARKLLDQG